MINRFLRRLSVRRRLIGGYLLVVLLLALSAPLLIADRSFLVGRIQQITQVDTRVDRLLLLAAARIESSRVNLMRYIEDYAPSAYESIDDVDLAAQLLQEARDLISGADQAETVTAVLEGIVVYRGYIEDLQARRQQGDEQEALRLLFQANRLGNDIGQRIEQITRDSESRLASANQTLLDSARSRLTLLIGGYGALLVISLIFVVLIERSITRPVVELRAGAEAFGKGQMDVAIPVEGADELGLLASTFNQMTDELSKLYLDLERRVAERTEELERQSGYLQAAAQVGHAATSILDTDQLIQQVVEVIQAQFGLYYVGLFLADEARQWAVLRAGTGPAGETMLARGHRIKVGEGMIGWSVAHAQARVALEAERDAVRLATAELPDTRSEAAVPLVSRGRAIGALSVQSERTGAFDQAILTVLQAMADQVAVAIDNARLYSASQAALESERRAYGEMSRSAWLELMRRQPGWGYRSDQQGVQPAPSTWEPTLKQAVVEGEVILAGNGQGQAAAVPIRVRDQVIGAIHLGRVSEAWADEDVELLRTLADQLGRTLDSVRLYQETQLRAAREQTSSEVGARMRESLDIETVLKTAATEIGQTLGLAAIDLRLELDSDPVGEPPGHPDGHRVTMEEA